MVWDQHLRRYEYPIKVDTQLSQNHEYCIFVSDLKKYLKNDLQTVKSIPDKSKLYFDKSSKFPRFKLEQTEYKRCIKINNADYVVVNPEIPTQYYSRFYSILETKEGYYGVSEPLNISECCKLLSVDPNSVVMHNDQIKTRLTPRELVYLNCITNKYPIPMITDDDLNIAVDKLNPVLTMDDVDQIYTMLKSSDSETVGLGLKLLTNYNVSETPCTVRFLLGSTKDYWKWCNAKTGVSVKNMLEAIDYNRIYRWGFPDILYYCKSKNESLTDIDKQLMQNLIMEKTKDYIKTINCHVTDVVSQFGINVDITVSKNE